MDRARAAALYTPAARTALESFTIEPVDLAVVAVSENVTFKVNDARDGDAYVLRLHRPGYHTLDELNAERVWTAALISAGIPAPQGVATRDGRQFIAVDIAATGERRHVGMLRWTPGEVLGEVLSREDDERVTEHYFERLGAVAARLHHQSTGWAPPAGFTRHILDREGLMGEVPFWGRFWEHPSFSTAERGLLADTRDIIRAALDRYGRRDATFSLIHADLHPYNVLVNGEDLTVIDFDDAAFGWHVYDIAVALGHYQAAPNFAMIVSRFLSGYRAHRPFADHDEAQLPMFILMRGLVQLGWIMQRPELDPPKFFDAMKAALCASCAAFQPAA